MRSGWLLHTVKAKNEVLFNCKPSPARRSIDSRVFPNDKPFVLCVWAELSRWSSRQSPLKAMQVVAGKCKSKLITHRIQPRPKRNRAAWAIQAAEGLSVDAVLQHKQAPTYTENSLLGLLIPS